MEAVKWAYDGTKATEREVADFLAALIRLSKPAVVVETGTYTGTTTRRLAEALKANDYGHLYTIENDPALTKHYAEMELDRTTFVNGDSLAYVAEMDEIDFAFVDCGDPKHRLEVLEAVGWNMTEGGFVALHDHHFYRGERLKEQAIKLMGWPVLTFEAVNGLLVWELP